MVIYFQILQGLWIIYVADADNRPLDVNNVPVFPTFMVKTIQLYINIMLRDRTNGASFYNNIETNEAIYNDYDGYGIFDVV